MLSVRLSSKPHCSGIDFIHENFYSFRAMVGRINVGLFLLPLLWFLGYLLSKIGVRFTDIENRLYSGWILPGDASRTRDYNNPWYNCSEHLQLCWFREIIRDENVFNLSISGGLYDFHDLNAYMSPSALREKGLQGGNMAQVNEKPLMEKITKNLDNQDKKRGLRPVKFIGTNKTDYQGRTCRFDALHEYKYYRISTEFSTKGNNLYLMLSEMYRGKGSRKSKDYPNAIYGVVKSTRTRSSCSTIYFYPSNRTYLIRCPIYEKAFHIYLNATFFDISSFRINCTNNTNDIQILEFASTDLHYKEQLLLNTTLVSKDLLPKNPDFCKGDELKKPVRRPYFWLKIGNQWHWYVKNCYYLYFLTKEQEECIRNASIINIGDSHTGRRFRYLNNVYHFPHFELLDCTTTMHLVNRLHFWMRKFVNKPTKRARWLVISSGQHDQLHMDPIRYIAYMSEVFTLIGKIKDTQNAPNIIWIETTPSEFPSVNYRMFNKRLTHALNDWVAYNMRQLGVGVLPAFDIASANPGNTVDNLHHNNEFGSKKVKTGVSIGGAISSVLFGMICPI